MNKITLAFVFLLMAFSSDAQNNPVTNLTWQQEYVFMHNYFELLWEEPATPHDELIGYNVYREQELFRFQTENSLHNLYLGSNCGEGFLTYGDNPNGFEAHVTAVYAGGTESDYIQTAWISPPALKNESFEKQQAALYPNPTSGLLNIDYPNPTQIIVCDVSGKKVREFKPEAQIDLEDFPKGMYLVRLVSDQGITTNKIIVE